MDCLWKRNTLRDDGNMVFDKLYWTDRTDGITDRVQQANRDGSGVLDLITPGVGEGIVLDLTNKGFVARISTGRMS